MDIDLINYLTADQKAQMMRFERLFGSEGWDDVELWAKRNSEEAAQRELNAQSWEHNRVAHGARLAFDLVLALRETTVLEFERLARDNMDAIHLKQETSYE